MKKEKMQAGAILTTLALFMIVLYFGHVPLPHTSITGVDYILRSFYHADIVHLFSNLLVLMRMSDLGLLMSPGRLVQLLLFLTIVSSLILYGINSLLPGSERVSIGFSGVLFGLIVVKNLLLGSPLETVLTDVGLLLLPGLVQPNVSFLGHLSGSIAGFIYVFLFEQRPAQQRQLQHQQQRQQQQQ